MADPREVEDFAAQWGLNLNVLQRQQVAALMDAGLQPSEILAQIGAPREAIGQALASESLGLQGGGFAPARGGDPMLGDITTGFFPARGGDPMQGPDVSAGPTKRFGGKSLFGGNPDEENIIPEGLAQPAGPGGFDLAMLRLDAFFEGKLAGVRELGDGLVEVALLDGGTQIFEFDDAGNLFPLDDRDPRNPRSRPGSGPGAGFRPAGRQLTGVDPRTGRAIIFDPNTGAISLGEQIGFRGIDPEREFALDTQEQQRKGAETTRDIIANGRNFLTAGFLASRGQLPLGAPAALSMTQADQLNALGAGAAPTTAAGFSPTPSRATASRDEIREGLDSGAGSFRIDSGQAPLPAEGPVTQDQLASLGRSLLPGRPKAVLEGEGIPQFNLSNIALPTPDALDSLTKDERGALDTQLQNEPNIQMTLDELEQQSQRAFRAPRRRTRGRARIV